MKGLLENDIIRHVNANGPDEIGPLPKGVGLERLRFDGIKVVDLGTLSEIWVEEQNGVMVLHAIEVPGSRKVVMQYRDRKRLISENGMIRLMSTTEMAQAQAEQEVTAADIQALKIDFRSMVDTLNYAQIDQHIANVFGGLTVAQRGSLTKLYKTVLYLAKKVDRK